MMVENLVSDYINWVKSGISYQQFGEWYEIETPFLNRHNDFIYLYLNGDSNRILLSDGGETLSDLL